MNQLAKALTEALGEPTNRIGRQVSERLEKATDKQKAKLAYYLLGKIKDTNYREETLDYLQRMIESME